MPLASEPFKQLVTIDVAKQKNKQNKKTPANLEQSVPHLYRYILILRQPLHKEKKEKRGLGVINVLSENLCKFKTFLPKKNKKPMLTSYWKVIKISCHLQTSQLLLLCEVCSLQKMQFAFVCYLPLSDIRAT